MTTFAFTSARRLPRRPRPDAPRGHVRLRALAWLPLLLLLVVLLLSALGKPVTQLATAANPENVTVTASVDPEIQLASSCSGAALSIGTLVPGDPAKETASDCDMTISTTDHAPGVDLTVTDTGAPGTDAMRCVSTCSAPVAPISDGQGAPLPTNSFAARLRAVSSGAAAAAGVWTVNASALPGGDYYDVQDSADTACQTSGVGDGTCSFRFAAQASATQGPGNYEADVRFEAFAR